MNTHKGIVIAIFFLALILTDVRSAIAQGFSVESKTAPTVVGAGTFVSLSARFTIALPQGTHGFRPLAFDTLAGRAAGDAYNWKMKEGLFIAGYVEAPQPLDEPEMSKQVFESIRNGMDSWARSQNGKLVNHKQFDQDGHPALEVRLEFPEHVTWQRYYLVSRRLYQASLALTTDQRQYETLALKVLDSFRVLSDAEVAAALKTKAAEAEPSPLPQEPIVSRVGSDAGDGGLRGKVKTVFREAEDLSGTWSVQGRKPAAKEYYNEQGNLTKRESYDYKGNLFEISVYGYLDRARVASRNSIKHEYNPPPMINASPPGATRPKSDPRYSNKFTFQYDDKKRLIEKSWFLSNGELSIRYVYKYSGDRREEFVYSSDGSLNQHYLSIFDRKGNETERTSFETRTGSIRDKHSYTYEFDAKGNWIKRTTSKLVTKDSKSSYAPAYVDHRTITYY